MLSQDERTINDWTVICPGVSRKRTRTALNGTEGRACRSPNEQNVAVAEAPNRLIGIAIDCADVGPMARFYERLLGFEIVELDTPTWAQLRDTTGRLHLNLQGEAWYRAPTWPERPGEQAKMLHLEVEVDDLETSVMTALEFGGCVALWQPPDRDGTRLRIVLDPAGHPVCLFLPGE
jgi:catechol 2,3-dioxygenase-like lactoylglutathione lyase family enzyme